MALVKIVFLTKEQENRLTEVNDVKNAFSELLTKMHFWRKQFDVEECKFYWIDEEGDEITISSNEDFMCAYNNSKKFPFKLHVKERTEQTEQSESRASTNIGPIHEGVICDGCNSNIYGSRYKCLVCSNYDLCSDCDAKYVHRYHDMVRIVNPHSAGYYRSKLNSPMAHHRRSNHELSNNQVGWILEHIKQHLRSTLKNLGFDSDVFISGSDKSNENLEMKISIANTNDIRDNHNKPHRKTSSSSAHDNKNNVWRKSSVSQSDKKDQTSRTSVITEKKDEVLITRKDAKPESVFTTHDSDTDKTEIKQNLIAVNVENGCETRVTKVAEADNNSTETKTMVEEGAKAQESVTPLAIIENVNTSQNEMTHDLQSPRSLNEEWTVLATENPVASSNEISVLEKYPHTIELLRSIGLNIDEKLMSIIENCNGEIKDIIDAIYGK